MSKKSQIIYRSLIGWLGMPSFSLLCMWILNVRIFKGGPGLSEVATVMMGPTIIVSFLKIQVLSYAFSSAAFVFVPLIASKSKYWAVLIVGWVSLGLILYSLILFITFGRVGPM